jgi:hypothetical protein
MLSADENPGLIYCMIGVVVIVMTAIGLSLMMDQRNAVTSGADEIRQSIEWDASALERVKMLQVDASARLARELPRLQAEADELRSRTAESEHMVQKRGDLLVAQRELSADLTAIEADFTSYRARYKHATWSGAGGEKLGKVKVRGGREYLDVVIVRVTEVGLEIRHEDGFARLQAPDLSDIFQDRFQWSDEERRKRLRGEIENQRKAEVPGVREAVAPEDLPSEDEAVPLERPGKDREQVNERRASVLAWKAKVSRVYDEVMEAAAWGGSGRQSSVPGRLETWKARETRLRAELARAQTGLSLARSELAEISPNDPTLIIQEGEP